MLFQYTMPQISVSIWAKVKRTLEQLFFDVKVCFDCVCVCVFKVHRQFSFSVQPQLSFSLLKVGKDSSGGKHWEVDIVLKFPQIKALFVACG